MALTVDDLCTLLTRSRLLKAEAVRDARQRWHGEA